MYKHKLLYAKNYYKNKRKKTSLSEIEFKKLKLNKKIKKSQEKRCLFQKKK